MKELLTRRDFVKAAGIGVGGAMLAACQPQVVEKVVKETVEVEKVVEVEAVTPPMKLLMCAWFHGDEVPPNDDNVIQNEIEKAFNVDIENWFFERWTWSEQFNARVAGGDIPDYWKGEGISKQEYVNQELISEVPIEMIAEYAPRVFDAAAKYNQGALDVWLGPDYNGTNYSTPWMTTTQNHPFTDGWRRTRWTSWAFSYPRPSNSTKPR